MLFSTKNKLRRQSGTARQQAKLTSQAHSGPATQRKSEALQSLARTATPPRITRHRTRWRFGEDLPGAGGANTEELPRLKQDPYPETLPGKIFQSPLVAAVDPAGRSATSWALRRGVTRPQLHLDNPILRTKADQGDFRNVRDQRSYAHRQGAEAARATSVLRSKITAGKNHQMCARTIEMSWFPPLEVSGSKDGLDIDERTRSETDRRIEMSYSRPIEISQVRF